MCLSISPFAAMTKIASSIFLRTFLSTSFLRVFAASVSAGAGVAPARAALHVAGGVVCRGDGARPGGACRDCRLSSEEGPQGDEPRERVLIDSAGKKGPLYRHVGDHPDLYWVDRGEAGTRVRITQVRAVQIALRLAPNEGGWRAAVIADAEWLNQEAQNALLRLLEEPPQRTCLVLVTKSAAG